MRCSGNNKAGPPAARLVKLMAVLWLAGVAMRVTILAVPPVIPLVHDELHMSETQVGLLIGLPLLVFAAAAIPGSLLIAWTGPRAAAIAGMTIAAVAGAARAGAIDVWTLYAAAVATGFGIAIMQPGVPTLVREWVPSRIALGTLAYTSGMVMASTVAPVVTIPYVLPLVGGSWRLDFLFWAVLALAVVPIFALASPKGEPRATVATAAGRLWWPDFKSPLIWMLGLTFASNNTSYFTTNAFIGDYLASMGRADQIGAALAYLNGLQIVAVAVLLVMANRLQQRAWPFLTCGPVLLLAFVVMIWAPSTTAIIGGAALVGFTTAITLTAILALPPALANPADLSRTTAGIFTISYTLAIVIPTGSGALWDLTGRPWTAFLPLCLCAFALTVLGAASARWRPEGGMRDAA